MSQSSIMPEPQGQIVLVGKTIAIAAAYPTVPAASFEVAIYRLEMAARPGDAPKLTDLHQVEFAANFGRAVPPPGTIVILGATLGGRYIFEFNG
ncbi:MAG: hypothetical protein P4L84_33040 [Isosphaeraceae bacterium]|nr:hypothetical protein [Isosphaeraceae bacterium]